MVQFACVRQRHVFQVPRRIEHIFFWRVKDRDNEQGREQTAQAIRAKIEGVRRNPGLLHLEAGVPFSRSETAYDGLSIPNSSCVRRSTDIRLTRRTRKS